MFKTPPPQIISTSIALLLISAGVSRAQYSAPNVITDAGDTQTVLGTTLFINHGLQGVGRIW